MILIELETLGNVVSQYKNSINISNVLHDNISPTNKEKQLHVFFWNIFDLSYLLLAVLLISLKIAEPRANRCCASKINEAKTQVG